ncbi:MAG: hypothetical protein IPH35_01260 [Rhodoferax sp.]|jgi:hypothetical protein|nr:hypothetical protein [Rhodoferax sp.]
MLPDLLVYMLLGAVVAWPLRRVWRNVRRLVQRNGYWMVRPKYVQPYRGRQERLSDTQE